MSVLIFAEHNGEQLHQNTLHAVYAAQKLGEVHVLVAGTNVQNIAEQASKINGVSKVLHADAPHYAECLAEEIAPLMVSLAEHYTHIGAAASAVGKNIMPRVAALLDSPQISDLTEILDNQTFIRPIYAGNVFTTVQSNAKKIGINIPYQCIRCCGVGQSGG